MNTPSSYEQDTVLDSKEFDRLYKQYNGFAYWAAINKGIPHAERDDFVQDVFLLIYEKYYMLKDKKYEHARITSLIKNRASNYRRDTKKYKHAELIETLGHNSSHDEYTSDTTPSHNPYTSSATIYNASYTSDINTPKHSHNDKLTLEHIKKLFEKTLTPEEKDICIKIIIEGQRMVDIIKKNDGTYSSSTLKMRFKRAKDKLKKYYSTKDVLMNALS